MSASCQIKDFLINVIEKQGTNRVFPQQHLVKMTRIAKLPLDKRSSSYETMKYHASMGAVLGHFLGDLRELGQSKP